MPNTNMDLNKPSKQDGPQLEFTLPIDEIKESIEVGQIGVVMIPVEVTQVKDGMVSFRKRGKASSQSKFHESNASEMRE